VGRGGVASWGVTAHADSLRAVRRVIAQVSLETDADKHAKVQRFRDSDWSRKPDELARIEQNILDPTKYRMTVTETAELVDGRTVTGGGFDFGGHRHGIAAIWHRYRGPRLQEIRASISACSRRPTT
jgi:hypothetical protein